MGGKQRQRDEHSRIRLDPTGVPNLDAVLGGGLPRGALTIVVGPPGSGKTTLANQMAFAAAAMGRKAIVFTALSEPTTKLIAHLSTFSFYDGDLVGDQVQFLSLQNFLVDGLQATGEEMMSLAFRAGAGLVVLDGFRGIRGVDGDMQAARRFLFDVGTTLSTLGTTTIITSEADPRDPSFFPEATTGDVIVGLHYTLRGVQQWRGVEIIKMRGAAPLSGLHGLGLSAAGTVVYPRLEARVTRTLNHGVIPIAPPVTTLPAPAQRARFGLDELDAALSGGVTRGTSTMLVGPLGNGKTFLSLHFALTGAEAGEPTVYVGFRESVEQLLQKTQPFDLGPALQRALAPAGNLTLLRWPPVEMNPDILLEQLFEVLDRTHAQRLVVDSVDELFRAVSDYAPLRVHNYMAAMVEELRIRGVTALFIKESNQYSNTDLAFTNEPISVLAENVIQLRQIDERGRLHRIITVLKTRFSAHDNATLREFVIMAPYGIRVLKPTESEPGIFTSISEGGPLDAQPAKDGNGRSHGTKNASGSSDITGEGAP
ncbi:MAG: AAA family ATPase [Ktedonobacterales bacterium]|nr:AAA family ATPase [Ktedonobacterales bacterium]